MSEKNSECAEAVARIREGVQSLSKLSDLAEGADLELCGKYLFQICTIAAALSDFAGLRAEAIEAGEG
jgi:hypothetical protein